MIAAAHNIDSLRGFPLFAQLHSSFADRHLATFAVYVVEVVVVG